VTSAGAADIVKQLFRSAHVKDIATTTTEGIEFTEPRLYLLLGLLTLYIPCQLPILK
jgi:hypothetical protein